MNTGQIVKSGTIREFVQLPNDIVNSKDLTLQEKGMLAFLLALPNDWVLYRNNLYDKLPDSPGTVDRVFRSLQNKGYILSVRIFGELGRFKGWNHVVYDYRVRDSPKSANTDIGESGPIQINNPIVTNTNTNYIQINKEEPVILNFKDDGSNQAWEAWKKYRKEIRKPISPSTATMQLRKLGGRPPAERIAIIKQSIENGWTGLFEIKDGNKRKAIDISDDDFLIKITNQ